MADFRERRAKLRRRIFEDERILVVPGTGDALGARLIQQAGFDAAYISGFAVEGSYGLPDVGFLSMAEVAERAGQIADAIELPVFADGDTGYGSAINVIRTVRSFEKAGIAAIQLEDQALPKKCGSMGGKRLVDVTEMEGKLKAALDAREDENLLIIARTDAIAVEGFDRAMERLARYGEVGADLFMVLGPYEPEDVKRIIKQAPGPLIYLNSESLTMPMIPSADLEVMGVRVVAFPLSLLLSAAHAMQAALEEIRMTGTTAEIQKTSMMAWPDFNQMVGLDQVKRWEELYE